MRLTDFHLGKNKTNEEIFTLPGVTESSPENSPETQEASPSVSTGAGSLLALRVEEEAMSEVLNSRDGPNCVQAVECEVILIVFLPNFLRFTRLLAIE